MSATGATITIAHTTADTATRPSGATGTAVLAVRIGLVLWSLGLAGWAVTAMLAARDEPRLGGIAARIAAGEPYKAELLSGLEEALARTEAAATPRPSVLRAAALIRLRQAELEVDTGNPLSGNPVFARAETTIRAALAVLPTDSMLWFGLSWLGKTRDGFRETQVPFLRLSYETGEHEGWVAMHRNALAVSELSLLPPDLQARALREFANLVLSDYIAAAADILAGPGWLVRDRLLAGLAGVPEDNRRRLARELTDRGLDVTVPGIPRAAARPWQ